MRIVVGEVEAETGWGECFVESREGVCFPSRGWTDNALVVVGTLVDGLSRMRLGAEKCYEWFFYDGPYRMELVRAARSDSLVIRGIEDRSDEACVFEDHAELREVLLESVAGIRRIDAAVSRDRLRSGTVAELDRYLAVARRLLD